MRIAVSGFYGFGNTGDEAIIQAIVAELQRRGHVPVVLSHTPKQTAQQYGCEAAARMNPLSLARTISSCDVLLSGGGGLLQDKTSQRNLMYYLGLIRLARLLGKRTVVFNQSIGPLSEAGGRQVGGALGGVRAIVRDQQSLETLAHLGIMARLGGDPALLLTPTSGHHTDGVVIAPRGDVHNSLGALQTLTRQLQAEGRRVVALSFYPHEDDSAASSLGADQMVSATSPQQALDIIAASQQVIGVRLHALILAAAAGVPFVGLSYDPKVSGFCADAGAPYLPTSASAQEMAQAMTQTPDWAAVAAMKERAGKSFDWALQKSAGR